MDNKTTITFEGTVTDGWGCIFVGKDRTDDMFDKINATLLERINTEKKVKITIEYD